MSQQVQLTKKVYGRGLYPQIIDTNFNQLIPPSDIAPDAITVPEFFEAYENLLVQQNEAYTDYRGWFDLKEKDKYEKARRLLLKVRSKSVIDYGEFRTHLRVTKDEFN